MKYEYRTAVLENIMQSVIQAKRDNEGALDQQAGKLFQDFMRMISSEGWRIVAINQVLDVFVYTLERPITNA